VSLNSASSRRMRPDSSQKRNRTRLALAAGPRSRAHPMGLEGTRAPRCASGTRRRTGGWLRAAGRGSSTGWNGHATREPELGLLWLVGRLPPVALGHARGATRVAMLHAAGGARRRDRGGGPVGRFDEKKRAAGCERPRRASPLTATEVGNEVDGGVEDLERLAEGACSTCGRGGRPGSCTARASRRSQDVEPSWHELPTDLYSPIARGTDGRSGRQGWHRVAHFAAGVSSESIARNGFERVRTRIAWAGGRRRPGPNRSRLLRAAIKYVPV